MTIKVHEAFENEPFVLPFDGFSFANWEEIQVYINQISEQVTSISGAQVSAQESVQVSAEVNYQVSNLVSAQVSAQAGAQVSSILSATGINVEKARKVLESIELFPLQREAILSKTGLSNHYKNYARHVFPLMEKGLLAYTSPDNLKSRNQQYRITLHGLILLKILQQA